MEYHLRTEVLQGTEIVFDGCQEQPVDLTLSLPDYCRYSAYSKVSDLSLYYQ